VRRKILFAAIFALASCRSVEFIPDAEYANRRKDNPESFHLYARKPDVKVEALGRLIFRNFYGNPGSEEFQRDVALEAAARGANCGYVSKKQINHQTQFRTNAIDSQNKHGGVTGEVQAEIETVEVTLFQCERK
jgi:hypothetical protein